MAILGILSSTVLLAVNPAKRASQARDAQRKTQLAQAKNALEAHIALKGNYPSTRGADQVYGDSLDYGNKGYEGAEGYIPNLAPDFIKRLPQDPQGHTPGSKNTNCTDGGSGFLYKSDGNDYKLMAHCTPETYEEGDRSFIDPTRDGDSTWDTDNSASCPTQVGATGEPWAYAVWSSDVSKCW